MCSRVEVVVGKELFLIAPHQALHLALGQLLESISCYDVMTLLLVCGGRLPSGTLELLGSLWCCGARDVRMRALDGEGVMHRPGALSMLGRHADLGTRRQAPEARGILPVAPSHLQL